MAIRPTLSQIETLVEFLERNPGIAKGVLRTNEAKMETKKKWVSLAVTLNSLGGANKTGRGWAKYWAEKKCSLKKMCQNRYSMKRASGDYLSDMSSLDKRLVTVMGDSIFNDSNISVEPFPEWKPNSHKMSPPYIAPMDESNPVDSMGEHVVFGRCGSPVAGSSRGSEVRTPSPHGRSESQTATRTRRDSDARINVEDMDRLAHMEERRVNAEEVTAQALADLTAALDRNSTAVENMANAMTKIAGALEGLSAAANAILQVTNVNIKLQQ